MTKVINSPLLENLNIIYRAPAELKPYGKNPRKHSKSQINAIAKSIETFGFVNPIVITNDKVIVAGHGRHQAALLLKKSKVPTICVEDMSPALADTYRLADNKMAELSGWDFTLLEEEILILDLKMPEFDLTVTGFSMEAPARPDRRRQAALLRTKKYHCLEQGQWRHGLPLSLQIRKSGLVQKWHGSACEQHRARKNRPLSDECLGLPGTEYLPFEARGRTGHAPDRQARPAARRRHSRQHAWS